MIGSNTPRPRVKSHNARGCTRRASAPRFPCGNSRIAHEPSRMAALQREKSESGRGTVDQMADKRRKKCGSRSGCPAKASAEQDRQQGHWADKPPQQAVDEAPGDSRSGIQGFVAKQQSVAHADEGTYNHSSDDAEGERRT